MFNNFSPKNATLTTPKNMVEHEEPQMTPQYGSHALHAGLTRPHARTRMHTPTLPRTYMHAHTHTHTDQYVILIANNDSRTLLNVPLYVHCLSCSTYTSIEFSERYNIRDRLTYVYGTVLQSYRKGKAKVPSEKWVPATIRILQMPYGPVWN
jgi:hypothetical protein